MRFLLALILTTSLSVGSLLVPSPNQSTVAHAAKADKKAKKKEKRQEKRAKASKKAIQKQPSYSNAREISSLKAINQKRYSIEELLITEPREMHIVQGVIIKPCI